MGSHTFQRFTHTHTHTQISKSKTNSKMNNQYFARLASKPVKRKLSSQQDDNRVEKDDEVVQAKKKKKKKSSKWKGGRKRYVRTSTFEKRKKTYTIPITDKMTRMMRNERKSYDVQRS